MVNPQDYTGENPLWKSAEPYFDSFYWSVAFAPRWIDSWEFTLTLEKIVSGTLSGLKSLSLLL